MPKNARAALLSLSLTSFAFVAVGCGGGGTVTNGPTTSSSTSSSSGGAIVAVPKSNTWAWLGGSRSQTLNGSYGTQGVALASNIAGARDSSATWTDNSGVLWLFGGNGLAESGVGLLNDLWKYEPASGLWTWVSGSKSANSRGSYSSKGSASSTNAPSARYDAVALKAANGDLWLFGGQGIDPSSGRTDYLNDLWRFSVSTGQWIWVSGVASGGADGVSAVAGTFAPGNSPGSRSRAMAWIDNAGNIWIYGGVGGSSSPILSGRGLDDLWKFDVALGQWALMGGTGFATTFAVYGTKGQAAASNTPGTRVGGASWTDRSGNLWLFGGDAYPKDASGFSASGIANDLWKFNTATGQWTWVAGSNQVKPLGVYGTMGVSSSANSPGARISSVAWTDASGQFWLYGGIGRDSVTDTNLNDLWIFNPATSEWTWMNGVAVQPTAGWSRSVAGAAGVGGTGNTPGSRVSAFGWADAQGGLWLFGGSGVLDTGATGTLMSDLWRFQI